MYKKIFKGVAGLGALFAVGAVNAATVSLSTTTPTVNDGDSLTLLVSGTEFADGVLAGHVTLTWDASILQLDSTLVDITASASANGFPLTFAGSNSLAAGQLVYNFSNLTPAPGPALDFFSLNFTAIAPAPGGTIASVNLGPASLGDWQNGLFQPITGIIFEPTTITVSAVPVPAAAWLFGSGLLGMVGVARRRSGAAVTVAA